MKKSDYDKEFEREMLEIDKKIEEGKRKIRESFDKLSRMSFMF